ncbi:MAG TPA: ABC transporter substrate-binding protein [Usitatibacter sp.]|nr:ABC transporter substrate-binding protein [Usitatibacter sp.]
MSFARVAAALLVAFTGAAWPATRTLEACTFPGGFNWPFWVGSEKGFFAAEGLEVRLTPATGSVMQIRGLAEGKFDIAISTIDNVVAYDEGQGEAKLETPPDFFAFMGAQYGAVRLVAQPGIHAIPDLKGKTLAVDAATTGYAFVLRKILQRGGLGESDYALEPLGGTAQRAEALMQGRTAATILTSPLEVVPESRGYPRLANAIDVVGPYQALTGVARRGWARENSDVLVAFLRAYLKSLEWLADPPHRAEAIAIYRAHLPQASDEIAGKAWDVLLAGPEGFQKKAKLDRAGIETAIALRREFAKPAAAYGAADKYIDETYYLKATQ